MTRSAASEGNRWFGATMALSSAALFGVSTPLAKQLLAGIDPWMLAALLYLGSGIGLALYRVARGGFGGSPEPTLSRGDWRWFSGAILAGGVVGPVCLMLGLTLTPAATASLLLNVEGVATALIAWFVFRENVDRRIAVGMAAIVAGAVVLSWQGGAATTGAAGPLYIVVACLAWAIDNNLTRKVALSDPVQIAMWKGLIAGAVNLGLAFSQGAHVPPLDLALAGGTVGLAGYGVSIALFVVALRHVGTARTGAYFSTAPFLGAVVSVLWLGEAVTIQLLLAGGLMAVGLWLHLTERHVHVHQHIALAHSHRHWHDEHHQHAHEPGVDPREPHTHWHRHEPLRHSHAHFPDAHHTHRHPANGFAETEARSERDRSERDRTG